MTALMISLLAGAAPDSALLEKLGARARQLEVFAKATRVTIDLTYEKLDGDGKVTKTTRTAVRVGRNGDTIERKLLAYEEDGKDLTESRRAESEAKREKPESNNGKNKDFSVKSPFHPELQAKYEFAILAPPPSQPQLVRIGFKPAGDKVPELYMGDATVDPETGDVLALSLRPSKPPAFVQSLSIEAQLEAQTPAGRAMSKLEVKGVAGLLFLKERFRVITTFKDYEPL